MNRYVRNPKSGMRAPRPSASRVWRQVLALAAILAVPVLTPGCNESRFKGSAERLNPTLTREFTQDAYPSREMTVEQGHSGDPRSESFEQGEWGALDIVVVIDNSPSMAEEQINLGSKLDPLLSRVAKADCGSPSPPRILWTAASGP